MIRVARPDEPTGFDERVRKRGAVWRREHRDAARPRDYWSEFREDLRRAFGDRCGYTALFDLGGTVDHFHCYRYAPDLAHEWMNYRYATGWINSSKGDAQPGTFMDPFEVENGWFEIVIPSMELIVVKERVPPHLLTLAERTLRALSIGRHERVIRDRRYWYHKYTTGGVSLRQLNVWAPQIAAAVAKRLLSDAHRSGQIALFIAAGLGLGSNLLTRFPGWREIPEGVPGEAMPGHVRWDSVSLFVGDGVHDRPALDLALRVSADARRISAQDHFVLLRSPSDADVDRYQRDHYIVVLRYSSHAEVAAILEALARVGPAGQSSLSP